MKGIKKLNDMMIKAGYEVFNEKENGIQYILHSNMNYEDGRIFEISKHSLLKGIFTVYKYFDDNEVLVEGFKDMMSVELSEYFQELDRHLVGGKTLKDLYYEI